MNTIKQLIEKYCPEGVEYKKLGEVCTYTRGVTYNKANEINDGTQDGWRVLRANNITLGSNTLNLEDVKIISKEVRVKDTQKLFRDDILICAGSGSKEHIGKVAYIESNIDYTFGGFMGVIRTISNVLNSRFLFHILTGQLFKSYLSSNLMSSTINNLNSSLMNGFEIPVPPLPVQHEIVRILDNFTSLEAELEAELEARRKQYEYYRDQLLSFKHLTGGGQ